jgi:hypothetical protein
MTRAKDNRPVLTFVHDNPRGRVWGFSQYFWLRYVQGFNPKEHCAKSLLGKHSRKVFHESPLNRPILLDEAQDYDFIYLCGVSENFKWSLNLHMPARPAPGQKATIYTYNGIRCVIRNAESVEIPRIEDGFAGYGLEFTTCRNWRFGVQHYSIKGSPERSSGTQSPQPNQVSLL